SNRYRITKTPPKSLIDARIDHPKHPYQPQDSKIGINRLGFFHLKNIYNGYIPKRSSSMLRIGTWNLHEWRNQKKIDRSREIAKDIFKTLEFDVIGLQEVTDV